MVAGDVVRVAQSACALRLLHSSPVSVRRFAVVREEIARHKTPLLLS